MKYSIEATHQAGSHAYYSRPSVDGNCMCRCIPVQYLNAGHVDISATQNIYAQANTKRKEEVMAQVTPDPMIRKILKRHSCGNHCGKQPFRQ